MPTAIADTPSSLQWPVAQVRPADAPFDRDVFEILPDVPVFAEHETTAKDGRRLRFGREELAAVCDRCNRRIRETGDYAAITLGHTPDPDSDRPQPDLVGFAGPFRIGTLGQPGARQRYAILADFHVFRDQLDRVKRHPRRSPELWLEESFADMFLDPIALLGAEAPRLDMGLLYSARRGGRLVEKYTAAAPAAANTFIPSHGERNRYAAQPEATSMPLTPDDIGQIVDALEQLDWVQQVRQLIATQQGTGGTTPPPEPPAAPDSPPPGDLPSGAPPAAPPPATDIEPPSAPPEPAGASPPPEAPPAGEEPEKLQQYSAADCDEMDDDEFEEYARARSRRRQKRKYEAAAEGSAAGAEKPGGEGVVQPASVKPAEGSVGDDVDGATGEYQGQGGDLKYSLLLHRRELEKMRAELDETRQQLGSEAAKRRRAERYSKLHQFRTEYAFDVDDELDSTDGLSDEQFESHVGRIRQNYHRIPVDVHAPAFDTPGAFDHDTPGGAPARARYSRQLSDRARQICEGKAARGEPADYEATLEALHRGEPVN